MRKTRETTFISDRIGQQPEKPGQRKIKGSLLGSLELLRSSYFNKLAASKASTIEPKVESVENSTGVFEPG